MPDRCRFFPDMARSLEALTMSRNFATILKDMTASSVHTPTAIGNEGGKKKYRSFKSVIAEAASNVTVAKLAEPEVTKAQREALRAEFKTFLKQCAARYGQPPVAEPVNQYLPRDYVEALQHAPVAKRSLHANADGATAKSPFVYDPNALGSLRPDQVPRFFGALTDSDKLPTKEVKLDDLHAMQDRVDPAKVNAIAEHGTGGKHAVVVQHNGKHYIADGHHRLAADWLSGKDTATVAFKDLEPVDQALKSAPQVDLTFAHINKAIDEGEGIVYGWAIVSKVDGKPYYDLNIDHAGEHAGKRVPENVPEATLAKCALGFVDGGAPGNVMHDGPDIGDFPFVMPMTTELFKGLFGLDTPPKTGLIVGYRPPADVLAKFRSGEFTGFSIEGSRLDYTEHQA